MIISEIYQYIMSWTTFIYAWRETTLCNWFIILITRNPNVKEVHEKFVNICMTHPSQPQESQRPNIFLVF